MGALDKRRSGRIAARRGEEAAARTHRRAARGPGAVPHRLQPERARKLTGFTNNKTRAARRARRARSRGRAGRSRRGAAPRAGARAHRAVRQRAACSPTAISRRRPTSSCPSSSNCKSSRPPDRTPASPHSTRAAAASGEWELFVQLAHHRSRAGRDGTVELARRRQVIAHGAGRAHRRAARRGSPSGSPARRARSSAPRCTPGGFDSLASDNDAWLDAARRPPARCLLCRRRSRLSATRSPRSTASAFSRAKDTPSPGRFDLAIHRQAPDAPPARVLCTMGLVPEELQRTRERREKSTTAIDWRRESPLLQHVSLDEVIFMDDPATAAGKDETALRQSRLRNPRARPARPARAPAQRRRGDARVHLLFHPERSTLPFRVAFPIFTANLVQPARNASPDSPRPPPRRPACCRRKISPPARLSPCMARRHSSRTEHADERGQRRRHPRARSRRIHLHRGRCTATPSAQVCSAHPRPASRQ